MLARSPSGRSGGHTRAGVVPDGGPGADEQGARPPAAVAPPGPAPSGISARFQPLSIPGGLGRRINEFRERSQSMGAKAEALAAQIEGKARDAVTTRQQLGDGDGKKVTAAEQCTVGATAHHLAGGLEAVAGIVSGIVTGAPRRGGFTRAVLDQMNAQTAREHADCARAETLAVLQKGAEAASAVDRS